MMDKGDIVKIKCMLMDDDERIDETAWFRIESGIQYGSSKSHLGEESDMFTVTMWNLLGRWNICWGGGQLEHLL